MDLNDPKTYEDGWDYASLDAEGLYKEITNAIGYSLYYMICLRRGTNWDERSGFHPGQYSRVVSFGRNFAREIREPGRRQDLIWLRKQLFLILDETENQC